MFVIRKKDTKEIFTVADKNDFVLSNDYESLNIKERLADLKLDMHPCFYKYDAQNGFVLISEKVQQEQERIKNSERENKIQTEMNRILREQAIQNLKARGEIT